VLLDFSGCDGLEIRLSDGSLHYRWEATRWPRRDVQFELADWTQNDDGAVIPASQQDSGLESVCRHVARGTAGPAQPFFTEKRTFWTGDTAEPLDGDAGPIRLDGPHRSLVVVRFDVMPESMGLLLLKSRHPDYFGREHVEYYEALAQTVGQAVRRRRTGAALRERVKELTCLYGISHVATLDSTSLPEILRDIVLLLPPAWQYPEITAARIVLDGAVYATPEFRKSTHRQSSAIVVAGDRRGKVDVVYLQERPEFAVGAFLPEEKALIEAVSREVSLIVERRESHEERSTLHGQLIHADRLATIGQLAAGVAHELNEPLGSILGFAQLAEKCPGLPEQAQRDIGRIVSASLHAREVIKKLLVFARQMPHSVARIRLNQVVEDGLYFLEARCSKAGIEIVRDLADDVPDINADPAQLNQVLVNLVVNAVHAMPDGGTLTVRIRAGDDDVAFVVEDTGTGMSEDILDKIFLPFFTTKQVDEGTGLGLAVVHGIVTAHSGVIDVESRPGKGSRFTVRLPVNGSGDLDHGQ
jgi:signal transduction histidine kinase